MITKLESLAKIDGGLVLIILVFLLIGIFVGMLLGYLVGYLVGRTTGKKMRSLTSSIEELAQALSGLRIKSVEKQPASSEVKFKKFPV